MNLWVGPIVESTPIIGWDLCFWYFTLFHKIWVTVACAYVSSKLKHKSVKGWETADARVVGRLEHECVSTKRTCSTNSTVHLKAGVEIRPATFRLRDAPPKSFASPSSLE